MLLTTALSLPAQIAARAFYYYDVRGRVKAIWDRTHMGTPWTTSTKRLSPVDHPEAPLNTPTGTFIPPSLHPVHVTSIDLFKSIARCSALSRSSASLVAALIGSSRALLEFLVDDATSVIAFLDEVTDLADAERTALSGRMGAGITDQTMEMLGFVWRDVAEQLIGSASPLADYVYENPAGELVLAEAKGSITNAASQAGVDTVARNAYHRQVDPYVYKRPPGAKGRPSIGLIEHGYAVAFAALPGPATPSPPLITAGAFLAIAQTDPTLSTSHVGGTMHSGSSSNIPLTAPVSAPQRFALRLGNYRAVFLLANAPAVVNMIDDLLLERDVSARPQIFLRVRCDNDDFLIGIDPTYPPIDGLEFYLHGWIFAIELSAANRFLEQLTNLSNQNFAHTMQVLPAVRATPDPPQSFLLSPDGFAMLRRDRSTVTHEVTWNAQSGLLEKAVPDRPL